MRKSYTQGLSKHTAEATEGRMKFLTQDYLEIDGVSTTPTSREYSIDFSGLPAFRMQLMSNS